MRNWKPSTLSSITKPIRHTSTYAASWRGKEATDRPPVVVDARPVASFVPPGGIDAAVIPSDEEIELVRLAGDCGNNCAGREEAADWPPIVVNPGPVLSFMPPRRVHTPIVADDE